MATSKKNTAKKTTAKKTGAKKAPVKKAPVKKTVVEPEVMPPEKPSVPIVYEMRKEEFKPALNNLEISLQNDIAKQQNFDKASAMMTIKIGLGLQFAKGLIKHGNYEAWLDYKFGEHFSKRNAQYATKLAKKFLTSEHGSTLELPSPQEGGSYLIVSNENSDNSLFNAVQGFVGNKSLPDLYAEHGIKAIKTKTPGGWRPATRLIEAYQMENAHLRNKDFEIWSDVDKDLFKEWQTQQIANDTSVGESLAAEGAFASISKMLTKHGLEDKSYVHLTDKQRTEHADLLCLVAKNMRPKKK